MYYVKINDTVLPTPYQYIQEAYNAMYELRSRLCAVCCDVVYIG